jgi:flagellar biosynthesis/type III secretory pathway protein FliH
LRQDQLRLQSFSYYDYGDPSYRYYREGQYYDVNQYGADLLTRAVNAGYEEGYRAGSADRQDGWQYDVENCDAFLDASFGYDGYYVDVAEYQHYFREGFRRGYEDGYYGRYQYGSYSEGKYTILGNILTLILDLTRY